MHAYLQTIFETPVEFQKDLLKTIEGVSLTGAYIWWQLNSHVLMLAFNCITTIFCSIGFY